MRFSKRNINILLQALKDPKKFLILLFVIVFAYVLNYDPNSYLQTKVLRVLDGDTVEIKINNEIKKIRLFGIDAPEKDQPYGLMAREFLNRIILDKEVNLSIKDEDKYGRILAIIYLNDKDINKIMVKNGFAWAYRYYSDLYIKEQDYAMEKRLGLWADEAIEPYKWRKQIRLK